MTTYYDYELLIYKYAPLQGWDTEETRFDGSLAECLERLDSLKETEFNQAFILGHSHTRAMTDIVDRAGNWSSHDTSICELAWRRGLLHTPPAITEWLATNPEQRIAQAYSEEKGLLVVASEVIEKECPQAAMRYELLARKALSFIR
jgi:hypothetical protein